jgi:hypothetical protein
MPHGLSPNRRFLGQANVPAGQEFDQLQTGPERVSRSIFLELLDDVKDILSEKAQTAEALASALRADPEEVYHCLTHLAANEKAVLESGSSPREDRFRS